MGASGPSTGGGGGVGPSGIKTDGTYGTKKDAKKASRRNEGRKRLKEIMEQNQNREGGGNNIMTPASEKKDLRRIPESTKILEASATSPSTQVKGDVVNEEEEYDARRTKRRGRRMTIFTPTGGVGGNLVLGKPTLLGS
jgi:hypothetical protein